MTNHDAGFQILMKLAVDKCMQDEITDFLSLDTSEVMVNGKTKRKVMNTVRRVLWKESAGVQILKRITVACLIVVAVLFATAMSIQPIRAGLWEAIITWYEDCVAIRIEKGADIDYPKIIEKRVLPNNLPEGWKIEPLSESDVNLVYQIFGTNGEYLSYQQRIIADGRTLYDNTECSIEEIQLSDSIIAYLIVYSEGQVALDWTTDQYKFSFYGENISRELLIQIAKAMIP